MMSGGDQNPVYACSAKRPRWLLILATIAIVFGLASIVSGGRVLFGDPETRAAAGEAGEMIANEINVYPNPATTFITIETNESDIESVTLYDALGRLINNVSSQENSVIINVANLSAGIYFVKIKTSNAFSITTFVKK